MRTKNPIVLIAVGATFALADHEMSSQATDSDNATALAPADTWSSSPIAGAIQPDRARPRRIVDTTAATTAEERVPKGMGWGAELSTLAKKSAALSKFLKVKKPRNADHFIQKAPELSETDREKLKREIDVIMPKIMSFDGILTMLGLKTSTTARLDDSLRIYIEDKTVERYTLFFKTIRKCARQGDSQKKAIQKAYRSAIPKKHFVSGEEKFFTSYYDEQVKEIESEVEGYVKQNYSLQQVIAHMNHEPDQQASPTFIEKIYRKFGADKLLEELRPQVELQLEKGATSDQVHAGLNADGSDEKSNIIESCITQWKKNREANIYKMLREWVVMGKSEGEIYQLLQNRGIPETLNTQDLITFGSMSKNPRDHIQMQYVEWYRDSVSPMEASAKLGGIPGRKGEPAEFIEGYIKQYEEAEKEIKEWLQDKKMNPDELSKKLRLKTIKKVSAENLWNKAKYAIYKQRWEDSLKT